MAEPLARVTFASTLQDLVEVAWRDEQRSQLTGWPRALAVLAEAVLVGIAVVGVLLLLTEPLGLERRDLTLATSIVVSGVVVRELMASWTARARLHTVLRRRAGRGPFPGAVELHTAGVVVRRLGVELRMPWAEVVAAHDEDGGCMLETRALLAAVPARAFADPAVAAHFVATARSLQQAARSAPASAPTADALRPAVS